MPGNGAGPDTFLSGYIQRAFGGFRALEDQFCAAGASIQGSGWAALTWDPLGHFLLVEQIHDHQDNTVGGTVPLLVLDMGNSPFYLMSQ
jgi:Fe-Mn family superoxide dismutase